MTPASVTLTATVRAAGLGDQAAWAALVHRFTPVLRSVAKGYGLQPSDIEDVMQGCWISLLETLPTLREPAAVGAWLVTTARRQSLRMRQREVRELLTDRPSEDVAASDCVETAVVTSERAAALRDAMRRLPSRQRTLLESLIAAPDRSYDEVSQTLGMPVGSIGPTRQRGLSRLRRDDRLAEVMSS